MQRPRVFITHCDKKIEPTAFAARIINLIGCTPVIAEAQSRLSKSVLNFVIGSMNSCDAVVVLATCDNNTSPSQGVLLEIGKLQKTRKFKGKYIIIKEDKAVLSPMIEEARYNFSIRNFGPIAEAILLELGSMGLFRNYYEMPGSEMQVHELIGTLSSLKSLSKKNGINRKLFSASAKNLVQGFVNKIIYSK